VAGSGVRLVAVDCEMSYTCAGLELTRATFVQLAADPAADPKLRTGLSPAPSGHGRLGTKVLLDTLVRPARPVTDFNTAFSGITQEMFNQGPTVSLEELHRRLRDRGIVHGQRTVLVGHSIDSDLRALKLVHSRVVDTAALFPSPRGPPFKLGLKGLAAQLLGRQIQEGDGSTGHDSAQDAIASLELCLLKLNSGPGFGLPHAPRDAPNKPSASQQTEDSRPRLLLRPVWDGLAHTLAAAQAQRAQGQPQPQGGQGLSLACAGPGAGLGVALRVDVVGCPQATPLAAAAAPNPAAAAASPPPLWAKFLEGYSFAGDALALAQAQEQAQQEEAEEARFKGVGALTSGGDCAGESQGQSQGGAAPSFEAALVEAALVEVRAHAAPNARLSVEAACALLRGGGKSPQEAARVPRLLFLDLAEAEVAAEVASSASASASASSAAAPGAGGGGGGGGGLGLVGGLGHGGAAGLDAACARLFEAMPKGAKLLVATQAGGSEVKALLARRMRARWDAKSAEQRRSLAGAPPTPWDASSSAFGSDEQKLRRATLACAQGAAFFATK